MNLRELQLAILSAMAECRECEGDLGAGFACVTCKQARELVAEMTELAASAARLDQALLDLAKLCRPLHSNETRAAYQRGVLDTIEAVKAAVKPGGGA